MNFKLLFQRQFIDDPNPRSVTVRVDGRNLAQIPVPEKTVDTEQGMIVCIPLIDHTTTGKIEIFIE